MEILLRRTDSAEFQRFTRNSNRNYAFSQNFHTRKWGEITVIYALQKKIHTQIFFQWLLYKNAVVFFPLLNNMLVKTASKSFLLLLFQLKLCNWISWKVSGVVALRAKRKVIALEWWEAVVRRSLQNSCSYKFHKFTGKNLC